MEFKLGWRRDLPDKRDRRYGASIVPEVALPPAVSLRAHMPEIHNQGSLGCCTAEAVCGLLHYRELTDSNPRLVNPSVLFQYYNTRVLEGTVKEDSGASIRNAVKAAAQFGMCEETCWTFEPSRFKTKPGKRCYDQAKKWKAVNYERVDETSPQFEYLLKHKLASGDPVVFGISVYDSIENVITTQTGYVALPGPNNRCLGGHAILLTGFNDAKAEFEFRNSWGTGWGDGGYGVLPYKYVTDRDLAADFWTIGIVP